MKRLLTYFRVWQLQASNKLQEMMVNRGTSGLFLLGKTVRFGFMLTLLLTIRHNTKIFGGYTTDQMMVFFLVYQFVDVLSQVLYRGVYMFQHKIRTGEFDFLLLQPINPLFQSLTWYPDLNDVLFLIPTTAVSLYLGSQLELTITISSVILFIALLINTFLIVTALHILVLVTGILTNEVDGMMWLYRDFTRFGQFPITIYGEPLRTFLFFIVPVGIMLTIPSQVLLGITPTYGIGIATILGLGLFLISIKLWQWALKHYAGASS